MPKSSKFNFNKDIIKNSRYSRFQDFHNLMQYRIQDILLVSSLYDSYIFEEDGRLYELIREEYQSLNLSHSPELIQVSSGEEALELAGDEKRFNLIITTMHIDDMHPITLAKRVKEAGLDIPVILLGYDTREMMDMLAHKDISFFERVFIWQGDYRIVLGIVKYLEDKLNAPYDTANIGVQVVILIEDSVRFYSAYLPLVYTEILRQSQNLVSEGLNLSHRLLRLRARPKILLCSTYEEAFAYYEKYQSYVLGIISDVDFSRKNKRDPQAGILLAKKIKSKHPDIPILLQSKVKDNEQLAYSIGASFLLKDSPTLLKDLRRFMKENFSFGEFIFKNEQGDFFGKANDLIELRELLKKVPIESILYHSDRNHFSNWLKARTEFWLADKLRPRKISDYHSAEELRSDLIESTKDFITSRKSGVILDFNVNTYDHNNSFARIGGGSLGGKARGLGFVNSMLNNFNIRNKFPGVEIFVPASLVISTDVFDDFMDKNNLWEFALKSTNDEELINRFIETDYFPFQCLQALIDFLRIVNEPLAVRSSSLLEDSHSQPFAGVYETFMLPNNHEKEEIKLQQLINSIKHIYASTYYQKAKEYINVTSYRLEEEKMAVIIQKMIGSNHDNKFYPELSGVAKSHNFYPTEPMKSTDGIVSVALGLGKTITDGGEAIRFCPKYPQIQYKFANIDDTIRFSQKEFFALDFTKEKDKVVIHEDELLSAFDLKIAESEGTLTYIASTYSYENDVMYDGIARAGVRVLTLAPILKHKLFPLPEIIEILLELGSWGMGAAVEIEFAVNLSVPRGNLKQFSVLQMRPLSMSDEAEEIKIKKYDKKKLICSSSQVLGNGRIDDVKDVVFINIEKFERSKSKQAAEEIGKINSKLVAENKGYILIGVGRWGTLDPWLGIPVTWKDICGAKAIVEANFSDINVTPSQGSHFFQNLTSFKIGYFTVNEHTDLGYIDWTWLNSIDPIEELKFIKHIRFEKPVTVKMNGRSSKGVILKP